MFPDLKQIVADADFIKYQTYIVEEKKQGNIKKN